MAYSTTEFIAHAFHKTGLLGAEETLSSADYELGLKILRSRLDFLQSVGINFWNGSFDSIPEEYLDVLATYMMPHLVAAFGGPVVDGATEELLQRPLRKLGAKPATGSVMAVEYF